GSCASRAASASSTCSGTASGPTAGGAAAGDPGEWNEPHTGAPVPWRAEHRGGGGLMGRVTTREKVLRIREGSAGDRADTLVVEEPMEIRFGGAPLTVTMRTPGHDFDLAAGFLAGEGVVAAARDITAIRYCLGATEDGSNAYNVVDVAAAPHVPPPAASLERNFYTSSSCGLCGKASIDAVHTAIRWEVGDDPLRLTPEALSAMPERLRAAQRVFDRTGGLHAAGLFDADGELLCLREDVGRHNAVDKLVGWALREDRL